MLHYYLRLMVVIVIQRVINHVQNATMKFKIKFDFTLCNESVIIEFKMCYRYYNIDTYL